MVYNNLGLALAEQGRFAEAEASYQQALRLNPHYADQALFRREDKDCRPEESTMDRRLVCRWLVRILPSRLVYRQNHSIPMIALPVLFKSTAA